MKLNVMQILMAVVKQSLNTNWTDLWEINCLIYYGIKGHCCNMNTFSRNALRYCFSKLLTRL